MLDFFLVSYRSRNKLIEIYPKFVIKNSEDLMIRGGDFYAVWMEEKGLWSTNELDALRLIDQTLDEYARERASNFDLPVRVMHMWDSESGMIDVWHKYCQRQMRDSYHSLDEQILFSNDETKKENYSSKRLTYALQEGEHKAWDRLMSVLYSPPERHKIEWAIGAIIEGDSKWIQKFMVLYGSHGTGKSTVIDIIKDLFEGYYCTFDAQSLGSSNNAFAMEQFRSNPMVAIDPDGDLSHLDTNTRINALVAHDEMTVNEKFKSAYSNRFKCFLIMATNKPVRITDAKSGLLRRLIDVSPSGNTLPSREYYQVTKNVRFELGAIAWHCREVYREDPSHYNDYIPTNMMRATNDFYNFVADAYPVFKKENQISLKAAYEMYKTYCEEAKVPYPMQRRVFQEELKNYFDSYQVSHPLPDGSTARNYYIGFRAAKFEGNISETKESETPQTMWLSFSEGESLLDQILSDCPAQYAAGAEERPARKWENTSTKLSDLDTHKLHYVLAPENHIFIDFDLTDEAGEKSYQKNLTAALKWPPTYAELSKSGKAIHLHYIYTGDPSKLSSVYDDHIEIKVSTGNSSMRRKLSKCNNLPIATISSGATHFDLSI